MDSKQVREIVEEILTEMEIFALPGTGYEWNVEETVEELEPDHYNLVFEVPELGVQSISFSTPSGSTPVHCGPVPVRPQTNVRVQRANRHASRNCLSEAILNHLCLSLPILLSE